MDKTPDPLAAPVSMKTIFLYMLVVSGLVVVSLAFVSLGQTSQRADDSAREPYEMRSCAELRIAFSKELREPDVTMILPLRYAGKPHDDVIEGVQFVGCDIVLEVTFPPSGKGPGQGVPIGVWTYEICRSTTGAFYVTKGGEPVFDTGRASLAAALAESIAYLQSEVGLRYARYARDASGLAATTRSGSHPQP